MFPTRINVGQLLLTFGRYVAIGAVEGLPEKYEYRPLPELTTYRMTEQMAERMKELGISPMEVVEKAYLPVDLFYRAMSGEPISYAQASRIAEALDTNISRIGAMCANEIKEEEDV